MRTRGAGPDGDQSPETGLALGALSPLVGYHLAQAAIVSTAAYERHVGQPFGLRKVEFSLLMLLQANGPLAPKQLAQSLALTAPNLTLVLDRLQQRGLLRRQRNPADGRSQHIVLSESGQALAHDAARVAATMERELDARLTRAEHAMLIELLGKVAGQRSPP